VVITIGLKAYLEDSYTPLLKSCWRHCLACAIVAERSAASAFLDKDFAHTAGVLHDIGRMAMAASMPHCYARVVEVEASEAQVLLRREREMCGIDHCQAGLALVEAWDLPVAFAEITSHHHDARTSANGVASLIGPSCLMADALGFPVIGYRTERSYQEILAEFPEATRQGFPTGARELASYIKKEIRVIESA
jgi:putative nucleotidyltransferase with HDIG domain